MRRFVGVLREDWPRLAIELLVLVSGITISFALDEWRRDREDRRTEHRAWEAIYEDLGIDSAYLGKRVVQLKGMTRSYEALLATPEADSLDGYMDRAISYVTFPASLGAYHELQQMAGSRLIRNHALLADLTSAYSREYERAREWDNINRDFILERMIPYLDLAAEYPESVHGGETALGLGAVYHTIGTRYQFRNLVRTNRLFKEAQGSVYQATFDRVAALRGKVAEELKRK